MLDAIIKTALRQRVLVLTLAVGLLVAGVVTAATLPVDVLPDLDRPTITVMSEAGGLSASEVEQLVTRPLETAMLGTPRATRVRSQSVVGLSIVWVELDWGAPLLTSRQQVNERLATVALPLGVTPRLAPVTSIMGEIMLVALTSKDGHTSPLALRARADTTLTRRLAAVPGVAQVAVIGGGPKTLQVALDARRMRARAVSFEQVVDAARGAQGTTGGGFVTRHDDELVVRNLGQEADVTALAGAVVTTHEGVPVRLGDVATVSITAGVRRGEAGFGGQPAVIMTVQKQPGASTLELTEALHVALAELRERLPDVVLSPVFEQAGFITTATNNVVHALRDGALFIVVILALFLGSARTTFITLVAIPLALAVTALVFAALDLSVNTMTLGGLAVAIGELVDDAVVDVENVFRRLRENKTIGRPTLGVVWRASREVRGSIVVATAIVVLVFVPLFALGGVEGRLFAPLGVAYIVSILASLAVAVTVTPVLASLLLPNARATQRGDGWLVRGLKALDRRVLRVTLAMPQLVLAGALVLVLGAVGLIASLGSAFLPSFDEGTLTINLRTRAGIDLDASAALGRAAELLALQVPEVRAVGRRTGRAEQDEHAEGPQASELDVSYTLAERPKDMMVADLRERLGALPGVVVSVGQPISHRLDHLLSGVSAPIVVKVRGPDARVLQRLAVEVEARARVVPGLVDVQAERLADVPELRIQPRAEAARYGFGPGALTALLSPLLGGALVAEVPDGERRIPLVVRLDEATRRDADALGAVPITTPSGVTLPLRALASIEEGTGPSQILREDGERRVAVTANITGRDLGAAVAELEATLAGMPLPDGYQLALEGQHQSQVAASARIAVLALVALLAMVLVLWLHFRALRLVLQVLLNIPLALVGSVVALTIAELPLSVATLVGFITLCGIASRNSILLIDHYLHLVRVDGLPWSRATLVQGSLDRLVPVLMTALTAGLGLLPLVLSSGAPGREILHPVAVVILGGLASSTALDLVVTPAAFWLFGRRVALGPPAVRDDGLGPSYQEPQYGS